MENLAQNLENPEIKSNQNQNEIFENQNKISKNQNWEEKRRQSPKYGARWKPKYAFLDDKTDYSERGFM